MKAYHGDAQVKAMCTYVDKLLELVCRARANGNHRTAVQEAFAYDVDKQTCRCSHGAEHHDPLPNHPHPEWHSKCHSTGCRCTDFEGVEFSLGPAGRQFVRERVAHYLLYEAVALVYRRVIDGGTVSEQIVWCVADSAAARSAVRDADPS